MVADVVVMMDRYRYSVNALDRHTVGLDRFHFKLNRLEDDRLDLDGFKKPHFKSERTGPGLARRRNGVLPCGRWCIWWCGGPPAIPAPVLQPDSGSEADIGFEGHIDLGTGPARRSSAPPSPPKRLPAGGGGGEESKILVTNKIIQVSDPNGDSNSPKSVAYRMYGLSGATVTFVGTVAGLYGLPMDGFPFNLARANYEKKATLSLSSEVSFNSFD